MLFTAFSCNFGHAKTVISQQIIPINDKHPLSHIMKRQRIVAFALLSLLFLLPLTSKAQLIVHGKPSKFMETEVHLLLGGSYVTQNYKSAYSSVSDVNNSMGFSWGAGFGVKFNITSFVGLGTELNYLRSSGKMDMAVITEGKPNVSNVFIKNSYRSFNIPIFLSFNFHLSNSVKWNADGGIYFDLGTSGSQNTTIYNANVNDLGQLTTTVTKQKTDYYDNDKAFLNSYRNFDSGLHLATGLTFMNKVTVGIRSQFGFRNVAQSDGIVKPSSHNIKLYGTIGYKF